MPASATMALSHVAISGGTVGVVSISARTTKCCIALAQCTTAPCYAIARQNSIVTSVRLKRSAVPTRPRAMFPVIYKKMPAMWRVDLWGQSASSSHGMNANASRCVLLTSRSITDLNACAFEGCPARVTNSISPRSCRILRPWRFVPVDHPLCPSSCLHREETKDRPSGRYNLNNLYISSCKSRKSVQNADFFDSIGPKRQFAPSQP